MAAVYLTIASGAAVSSAFTLDHAHALAVEVPSHSNAWGLVRVEFAPSATGPFGPYWPAGASSAFIWQGAGPGFGDVPRPPTPYGRVSVTNSTAITCSFGLYATPR